MKRLLTLLTLLCFMNGAFGTENDRIYIAVLPSDNNIPSEAGEQLRLKLNRLLMQNGIANDDPNSRFVLTTKVSVLSKEVVAGPPQKVSMNLDFTFIIGDAEENKKFESVTISAIGVGLNENKAFISAIKNIKPQDPELVRLLGGAKKEIVEYYSVRCGQIKNEAEREAAQRNYERAIYLLVQIPEICDCAETCQTLAIQYSNDYLNHRASELLSQAQALWAANPNSQGASEAADIIAEIPANSKVQAHVEKLMREISSKLKADEKKAWEFKMKQYNDKVEKQKRDDEARLEQQRANNEYRSIQQSADIAARRQAVEAARQIGIAYANNQPQSITYQRNVLLW